ncbi:MAG: NYN domain-containing protein, partial [Firmicutes bacterium]|nr:NYN domain-containing protein [Bacillota bacterium]
MEYLIIDGYNVIGGWPELAAIMKHSPEDARHLLLEALREYQSYTGQHIILVFDAYRSKGAKETQHFPGLEVRYTDFGQTADSLIESLVSRLTERKESV